MWIQAYKIAGGEAIGDGNKGWLPYCLWHYDQETHRCSVQQRHNTCIVHTVLILTCFIPGPGSIFDKRSYWRISQSIETPRFISRIVWLLWNLTGTSAVVLPMSLAKYQKIRWFNLPILQLRDFTRHYDKTSSRILKQGPGYSPTVYPFPLVYIVLAP